MRDLQFRSLGLCLALFAIILALGDIAAWLTAVFAVSIVAAVLHMLQLTAKIRRESHGL